VGKRKREHRQAVASGEKPPYRASPNKTKLVELSTSEKIMSRVHKIKEQKGEQK